MYSIQSCAFSPVFSSILAALKKFRIDSRKETS
ncbi:hypothetical protein Rin_00003350, partial [Candidatus Regiella insecticola 5.15]